jgi:hypothetical protein
LLLQVDHISPTSLNTFNFCSAKWDYSRQENLPQLPVDDDHMTFGAMVHLAIQDYYSKLPDNPRVIEIDGRAKQSFSDYVDVRSSVLKARYQVCLSNFVRFETGRLRTFKVFKPDYVEHKLVSSFVHGKVDAYWKTDQTVIDWKTGSFGDGEINDDYIRQGSLYRKMLNESNMPCNRVLFVMLITGRVIEIPRVTDAWINNEINKMLNGIIRPHRGPWCKNCQYLLRCDFQYSDRPLGLWEI